MDAESIPLGYVDTVVNTRFDFNESTVLADRLAIDTFDHCYQAKNTKIATLTSRKNKISLEAQGYPEAIDHPALEQYILRPGELYQKYVIYRYSHID